MKFYDRLHFQLAGNYPDTGRLFQRPLSLFGPENRDAINAILVELENGLSATVPSVRVELHTSITTGLIETMQRLETVFPEDSRYTREDLSERLGFRDAYVLVVRSHNEPIAFTLCYHDPIIPDHVMFGDVLAVKPEWQQNRIGIALVETVLKIPTLTGYTDFLLYCREQTKEGKSLVAYYKYFGGRVIDSDDKVRILIPLRAKKSGSRRAHKTNNQAPYNKSRLPEKNHIQAPETPR